MNDLGHNAQAPVMQRLLEQRQVLRRHFGRILAGAVLGAALAALLLFRAQRHYTSEGLYTVAGSGGSDSRLAGLAAQFGFGDGVSLRAGAFAVSTDLMMQLAESDEVLNRVLLTPIDVRGSNATVMAHLRGARKFTDAVLPRSPSRQQANAIRGLRSRIILSKYRLTNTVRVTFTADDSATAQTVLQVLGRELNRTLVALAQSQAQTEREFLQRRIVERREQMELADRALTAFERQNRDYRSSPDLGVERERLQRASLLQQQLFTALSQASEDAALRSARDTPALLEIEAPSAPREPDRRPSLLIVACFAVMGSAISWILLARRDGRHPSPTV